MTRFNISVTVKRRGDNKTNREFYIEGFFFFSLQ